MSFSLRKLFKNASYLYIGNIGIAVLAFVQGIIFARTIGPAQYGIWGVVISFSGIVGAFSSFRTVEPLTQYLVKFKISGATDSLRLLFATAVVVDFTTSLLAYCLIVLISPWAAQYVAGGENAVVLYRIFGLTVLLGFSNSLWYCTARDQGRFQLLAVVPFVISFIRLSGVIVLWQFNALTLLNMALLFVFVGAINLVINILFIKMTLYKEYQISLRSLRWRDVIRCHMELSGFWRFMKITYLSSMVSTLVKNGDVLILGYFRTDAEVGWYRLAKNLASMIQQTGGALSSVIYQDFNELITAGKIKEVKRGILRLLKVMAPVILFGAVIGMAAARPVIMLVYGDAFSMAVIPFRILLIGTAVVLILFWAQPMVLARGYYAYNLVSIVVVFSTGCLAMIPIGQLYGSAGIACIYSLIWVLHYSLITIKSVKR